MWNSIKKGFGYAFGGRIGWELGGLVWRLVSKFFAFLALGAVGLVAQCSAHNYTDGAAKAKAPQAQTAEAKPHHRHNTRKAPTQESGQADAVPNPTTINQ